MEHRTTTPRVRLLNATLLLAALFALALIGSTLHRLALHGWPLWLRPWCTVAASSTVLLGAGAALRGRTWGLLVLVLSTTSFVGATAAGIAPLSFVRMTALGLAALALAAAPLARRDPAAFAVAVTVCVALGAGAAACAGPGLAALGLITL